MITLEEYKQYLINFYIVEYDSTKEKLNERNKILSNKYPDELLLKIINDTYDFIYDIYNTNTLEHGYCEFKLEDNTESFIKLDLIGGWFSDRLFSIDNKIISESILKRVFGNSFMIYIREDEIEEVNEEDIYSLYDEYYLYMQGFPNNMNKIKKDLFGKTRVLK